MKTNFEGRDLISISDLTKEEIEDLLDRSEEMRKSPDANACKGRILASCFFEPSTRTRLSFEAAMYRLGGNVIGFAESGSTSIRKGETLADTIKVVGSYADVVVIRHPHEGSARLAASVTDTPVINAGDGANQHPTQTLIDLFTIRECQGKIDGLSIAIAGDLKYGRTVHSLCLALSHYAIRLYLISPESLQLPEAIVQELRKKGLKFSFHASIEEALPKVDILYMQRIQKERMQEVVFSSPYVLKTNQLHLAKSNLRILHALPRLDEIDPSVDQSAHAYYFQQTQNGVCVRMALLAAILRRA